MIVDTRFFIIIVCNTVSSVWLILPKIVWIDRFGNFMKDPALARLCFPTFRDAGAEDDGQSPRPESGKPGYRKTQDEAGGKRPSLGLFKI